MVDKVLLVLLVRQADQTVDLGKKRLDSRSDRKLIMSLTIREDAGRLALEKSMACGIEEKPVLLSSMRDKRNVLEEKDCNSSWQVMKKIRAAVPKSTKMQMTCP
jgi:hypothetical protein